jgi:phage terminase large subunit
MPKELINIDEMCNFTEKQLLATQAADTHAFTLFGGARGPGKSYWLRWYCLRFLVLLASLGLKRVVVAIFCEDYPTLIDRQVSKMQEEFPKYLGEIADRKKDHGFAFYLKPKYGSGVILLRNLDAGNVEKYQSSEFALVAVDELTKSPVRIFDTLRGSLRWPGIRTPKFISATNPGGIGAHWVKSYFIDRIYPEELQDISDMFAFVQALPTDNPHLDESYWEMLKHLPSTLAKAWLYGDWNIFEGQAFPEFYEQVHVVEPFSIPAGWERFASIDWGYAKPFAIYWHAESPDGIIYTYREFYGCEPGKPNVGLKMVASEVARRARDMESESEDISFRVADNSMWANMGSSNKNKATCIADEFFEEGFDIIPCTKDRVQMKQQIHMRLKGYEESESSMPEAPAWIIFDNCPNLIRTLPAICTDRNNPEKLDTQGEDHAVDSCGYLFLKRPFSPEDHTQENEPARDIFGRPSRVRTGKLSWMAR